MKKTIIVFVILVVLFFQGCSELGYYDKEEINNDLCKKCYTNCGQVGDMPAFFNGCFLDCVNSKEHLRDDEFCNSLCNDQWNNKIEVIEYKKCYAEKCNWICGG